MALETAFQHLYVQLLALQEAWASLRTTVTEDKPIEDDVVLVDVFGDTTDDVLGWLEGGLIAAYEAQQAVTTSGDTRRIDQALLSSQNHVQQAIHRFTLDLQRYERIDELVQFGLTRGGEWQAWTIGVRQAIDGCQEPMFDAIEALFGCWQVLAGCASTTTFSMNMTTIGQHVRLAHGTSYEEAS